MRWGGRDVAGAGHHRWGDRRGADDTRHRAGIDDRHRGGVGRGHLDGLGRDLRGSAVIAGGPARHGERRTRHQRTSDDRGGHGDAAAARGCSERSNVVGTATSAASSESPGRLVLAGPLTEICDVTSTPSTSDTRAASCFAPDAPLARQRRLFDGVAQLRGRRIPPIRVALERTEHHLHHRRGHVGCDLARVGAPPSRARGRACRPRPRHETGDDR